MLISYFKKYPFTFLEAENGQIACQMIQTNSIDIVLMDMKMPVMDGYDATKWIKDHQEYQHLPIIAVTASTFREDKEKIVTLCDGYLRKPVSKKQIIEELKKYLKHKTEQKEPAGQVLIKEVLDITEIKTKIEHLPPILVEEIVKAIKIGKIASLKELMKSVKQKDDLLGDNLIDYVDNFDLDTLRNYFFK
ncbi:MAG: response regulator [Spirochaetes bacterium]|nr:response regulator [Spirochaetota bacterium]